MTFSCSSRPGTTPSGTRTIDGKDNSNHHPHFSPQASCTMLTSTTTTATANTIAGVSQCHESKLSPSFSSACTEAERNAGGHRYPLDKNKVEEVVCAPLQNFLLNYTRLLPEISRQYDELSLTDFMKNRRTRICFSDLDEMDPSVMKEENKRRVELIKYCTSPLGKQAVENSSAVRLNYSGVQKPTGGGFASPPRPAQPSPQPPSVPLGCRSSRPLPCASRLSPRPSTTGASSTNRYPPRMFSGSAGVADTHFQRNGKRCKSSREGKILTMTTSRLPIKKKRVEPSARSQPHQHLSLPSHSTSSSGMTPRISPRTLGSNISSGCNNNNDDNAGAREIRTPRVRTSHRSHTGDQSSENCGNSASRRSSTSSSSSVDGGGGQHRYTAYPLASTPESMREGKEEGTWVDVGHPASSSYSDFPHASSSSGCFVSSSCSCSPSLKDGGMSVNDQVTDSSFSFQNGPTRMPPSPLPPTSPSATTPTSSTVRLTRISPNHESSSEMCPSTRGTTTGLHPQATSRTASRIPSSSSSSSTSSSSSAVAVTGSPLSILRKVTTKVEGITCGSFSRSSTTNTRSLHLKNPREAEGQAGERQSFRTDMLGLAGGETTPIGSERGGNVSGTTTTNSEGKTQNKKDKDPIGEGEEEEHLLHFPVDSRPTLPPSPLSPPPPSHPVTTGASTSFHTTPHNIKDKDSDHTRNIHELLTTPICTGTVTPKRDDASSSVCSALPQSASQVEATAFRSLCEPLNPAAVAATSSPSSSSSSLRQTSFLLQKQEEEEQGKGSLGRSIILKKGKEPTRSPLKRISSSSSSITNNITMTTSNSTTSTTTPSTTASTPVVCISFAAAASAPRLVPATERTN